MPSVLVLGAQGMLGRAVAAELRAAGLAVLAPGRADFDARRDDPAALPRTDWVVNAIGVLRSRIDEADPASVRAAFEVNAAFPRRLAAMGARIVHITTDAVFAGAGGAPYDERAPHDGVDAYARSKSEGEVDAPHVVNLRCSIVGPEAPPGRSLLAWLLSQPRGARVDGYANHRWNGLTNLHLARLIRASLATPLPNVLHAVPADAVTKAELLSLLARAFGREDLEIVPVDAPQAVDLRLATIHGDALACLWRAAGYDEVPTIAATVDELAANAR
jgi:dTDP-4-dehydrorhamnose reductase